MHFSLGLILVAVASVIALPVPKMSFDPQAEVQGKLEVRGLQVSSWFQILSLSQINCYTTD